MERLNTVGSSMQYLDLATSKHPHVEIITSTSAISKAKSWTSPYEHGSKAVFNEGLAENNQRLLSVPCIIENPLDSYKLHKEVSRSPLLGTYTASEVISPQSTDTFENISKCVEVGTVSEHSKVHYKKCSPKFKKNVMKDGYEHPDMSMMMSPVVKRKMSKANDVLVENESVKSNMGKRTSVVFNLIEEGKITTEVEDDISRIAQNNPRRNSQFAIGGHRPSIFSVFSQVAGRSHRPSIFSRLSDFSIGSLRINYSWNFSRIFMVMFLSCSFFILVTFLLIFFWPKFEFDVNSSKSFRHI